MKTQHLGGYYTSGDPNTWMPDVWGFLIFQYNIKSVVDIGCGLGHNIKWFDEMGLKILGVEGDAFAIENSLIPKNILHHDFSLTALNLNENFDLAISTEFVEHLDQCYENNWLSVLKNCKYFLMSHAVPKQKGHHHVNCQTSDYWVDKLAKNNFIYHKSISLSFRESTCRYPTKWGRNTLLFFEKNEIYKNK
jgi:SAM-dependent methyltransferase